MYIWGIYYTFVVLLNPIKLHAQIVYCLFNYIEIYIIRFTWMSVSLYVFGYISVKGMSWEKKKTLVYGVMLKWWKWFYSNNFHFSTTTSYFITFLRFYCCHLLNQCDNITYLLYEFILELSLFFYYITLQWSHSMCIVYVCMYLCETHNKWQWC